MVVLDGHWQVVFEHDDVRVVNGAMGVVLCNQRGERQRRRLDIEIGARRERRCEDRGDRHRQERPMQKPGHGGELKKRRTAERPYLYVVLFDRLMLSDRVTRGLHLSNSNNIII